MTEICNEYAENMADDERQKPYGYATQQAIDEIVMATSALESALSFLIESNIDGAAMRQVAKIATSTAIITRASRSAQVNVGKARKEVQEK
jgi:hypothetical protein